MEVISASGEEQARAASATLRGGFSGRLAELVGKLENLCARLELSFDFDEEAAEQADVESFEDTAAEIVGGLNGLTSPYWSAMGELPRVVLAGPTNAGKSTLFNALLGQRRTAVADEQGTTRDPVESVWHRAGVKALLVDTAGFKPPKDAIEAEAMAATVRHIRDAAVVVLCDAECDWEAGADREVADALSARAPGTVIRVLTKSDLGGNPRTAGRDGALAVSAVDVCPGVFALPECRD
jgi:tRNA modification GTPase